MRNSCLLLFVLCFLVSPGAPGGPKDLLAEVHQLTAEKKFRLALKKVDELLAEQPGHVEARLYRGVILTRQDRIDEAIDAFDALAREQPTLPEPHNNLAVLYASRHRYEDARLELLKAIELQPGYDTAQENLGDIYAKLASNAYHRAYRLNNDNTRSKRKAELLAQAFEARDWNSAPASTDPGVQPQTEESDRQSANDDAATSAAARRCYRTGPFDTPQAAARAQAWLRARGATAAAQPGEQQERIGYRVYLAPLESRAAADAQIARMTGEGIEDIFRITGGELDNGIALGVYRSLDAAEHRAVYLRGIGYRPSIVPRLHTRRVWHLDVSAGADLGAHTVEFGEAFPNQALAPRDCSRGHS